MLISLLYEFHLPYILYLCSRIEQRFTGNVTTRIQVWRLWKHHPDILGTQRTNQTGQSQIGIQRGKHHVNKTTIHDAYVNYKSEVTRYLSQIVKNQQDAEDLTQECFIRMMNVSADIPEERLLYYLKRIARNLAMDTFRKRTRTLKRDSKLEMQTYHCDTSELEITEGVNDLVSIINNTEHRKILELRVIHGYSIKETAQLVNRSEGMIKSSVFHAVNRIRAKVIS
ncbi:hypothetical protein CS562_10615 [Paenibacillus sp. LK1]|nr:hypothetical protein CS562_10615 [Paenibacillus sp. LK1]